MSESMIFGVPLIQADLIGFAAQQAALVEQILALRAATPGIKRSNRRGWHSDDLFHHLESPEVKWLVAGIKRSLVEGIPKQVRLPRGGAQAQMIACWANVNDQGSWNMPHAHFPSDWSGVCYIDAEAEPGERGYEEGDGNLILINPVTMGPRYHRPASQSFKPVNGRVVIFPGYLVHMVAPQFSARPRISVAFNFELRPRRQRAAGSA